MGRLVVICAIAVAGQNRPVKAVTAGQFRLSPALARILDRDKVPQLQQRILPDESEVS
jgi:hypothetical protein